MARRAFLAATLYLVAGLHGCSDDDKTVVVKAACNATYPQAPEGVKVVVHVAKGCDASSPDGSAGNPYPTIAAALIALPTDGGAVLIAGGTYDESVSVDKPASLFGSTDESQPGNSVSVQPSKGLGVTVAPKDESTEVTLSGINVKGATGVGVWQQKGKLIMRKVSIVGTQKGGPDNVGYGMLATGGTLDGDQITVDASAETGVLVSGGSGSLKRAQVKGSGLGGLRVDRTMAGFTLDGSELVDNVELGIGAFAGPVTLTNNKVTGTKVNAMTSVGDGILVTKLSDDTSDSPIDATVEGNTVTGAARVGVLLGRLSTGKLRNNEVSEAAMAAAFGAGVWMQSKAGGDAGFVVEGNKLRKNRFAGLGATSGARANVSANTIEDTAAGMAIIDISTVEIGDGVGVFDQTSLTVRGNTIARSARFGVIVDGTDSATTRIDGNEVSDNVGDGVIVQNVADSTMLGVASNTYKNNPTAGPRVLGPTDTPLPVKKEEFKIK